MKNEVSAFVEWFEKERETVIDRIFKLLEEKPYEELGCGIVMELHQEALTAAAEQIARARADQKGSTAAVVPFTGYEEYRYSLLCEGSGTVTEYSGLKKRRGPNKKQKEVKRTDDTPTILPTDDGKDLSTQTDEQDSVPKMF